MMRETILYISGYATGSDSVFAALETSGYEVVSTTSLRQAIALLYVIHSVAGVVLHPGAGDQTSFDTARSLRTIHPDARILLLCPDQIDPLPSCVDARVSTEQPLEKLASEVRSQLMAKPSQVLA